MREQKLKFNDETNDKEYFTIVPNYVLNHSSVYDRALYIQMRRMAGDNGSCWASKDTLAKLVGISKGQVIKSLNYLLAHRWVRYEGKRKGATKPSYEYTMVDIWKLNVDFYHKKDRSYSDQSSEIGHPVTLDRSPGEPKEDPLLRISKRESHFVPPSFEEVKKYCGERDNGINPQQFIDFYESKGWLIGTNKMKDWRAAVRTWEARNPKAPKFNKVAPEKPVTLEEIENRKKALEKIRGNLKFL